MRIWYEEEIPIADRPPGVIITLRGIINPVSPILPLIEIELIESSEDQDAEDIVRPLYQHNPTIGHHEFSLDDVLVKYSPKINKLRDKIIGLSYEEVHKL